MNLRHTFPAAISLAADFAHLDGLRISAGSSRPPPGPTPRDAAAERARATTAADRQHEFRRQRHEARVRSLDPESRQQVYEQRTRDR